MIRDFLQALAGCLRELLGEEYPLYFGRVLQGAKKPCLVLEPPEVSRRVLSAGRVQREYGVELRFYPAKADGLLEQQKMGERLICALDELFGADRNYRGRELKYVPGEEYLLVSARYDVITLKSLENGGGDGISHDMMLELGLAVSTEEAEEKEAEETKEA